MSKEIMDKSEKKSKFTEECINLEEKLEDILSNLEYNEFPIWKKNQINGLIEDIQRSKRQEEKEKKFFELIDLIDD